ncbi:hypothetical protein BG003_011263 [Podila horticola]|nr:hypothetical protein BG003_011263 [Podila horticola]
MRLPSLILLASVALTLTVQARERNIVDVVLQVNGEIQSQDGQPPAPEVTAPRRQGKTNEPQNVGPAIPEVTAPIQAGRDVVQANAAGPTVLEVTAPKQQGHGLQADAVGPAGPAATAPRRASKKNVAAKVIFDAAVASVGENEEQTKANGKGIGKDKVKGKGGDEADEKPTRTTDPEHEAGASVPEVAAPRALGRSLQAQAHFADPDPADPADPEVTAPRAPGKGVKSIVKVKILRRGDDVVDEAGVEAQEPDATAPVPQVTAPIMEADCVHAPKPEVTAPSRPDKYIAKVKVRVNGKVVADGDEALETAEGATPDPDVTAPAPPKPAVTAPSDPGKNEAKSKFVRKKSALEKEQPSDWDSAKKPAGLLNGFLGGLLGIDVNLGGKKKSKKAPAGDDEKDWDHLRLYGDDGYEPRPLPVQPDGEPNCEVLPFRDQMIWDQQGDRGRYVNVPTPEERIPKSETVAKPVDEGTDVAPPSSSSPDTDEIMDDKKIADIKDNKGTVDPSGIRICLLGPCDDDSDDEGTRIDHKQKEFLRQFKGKALRIDIRTGCPLSSDKLTQ